METPETCAACGRGGRLDPYRDIAAANGWPHEYAHLDCARCRVRTVLVPVIWRHIHSLGPFPWDKGEDYTYEETGRGVFATRRRPCECKQIQEA